MTLLPLGHSQRRDYTVQFNKCHQNIEFAAEVSETETKFLDTTEYKGERFKTESVLDVHPSGVKRDFIIKEALRLLRT